MGNDSTHFSLFFFHSILDVSPHLFLPLHSGITSTIPYVSFLYHNTHGFLLCPGFESQPLSWILSWPLHFHKQRSCIQQKSEGESSVVSIYSPRGSEQVSTVTKTFSWCLNWLHCAKPLFLWVPEWPVKPHLLSLLLRSSTNFNILYYCGPVASKQNLAKLSVLTWSLLS